MEGRLVELLVKVAPSCIGNSWVCKIKDHQCTWG